jgi:hypothetical protein
MPKSRLFPVVTVALLCTACSDPEIFPEQDDFRTDTPTVGLGLYFLDGSWNPDLSAIPDPERPTALHVVDGPLRHPQEIYLAARAATTPAAGLAPLMVAGDFSGLNWTGVALADEDWRVEANGVTWQHQRFFRGAHWMDKKSEFTITVLDAEGDVLDEVDLDPGKASGWKNKDDFFERRFVARVVSTGCVAEGDCSNPGASHLAEGLVQLRNSLHPEDVAFEIPPEATDLEVTWSEES